MNTGQGGLVLAPGVGGGYYSTEDAGRAFLTIDSGFPLVELEETLRGGKPFTLPYPSSPVPVLFTPNEWTGSDAQDVADALLRDAALARLYSALGQMDAETAASLRQAPALPTRR